jgi:mannose-6-phosphate isomerase
MHLLTNPSMDYAWGSFTAIPKLMGLGPSPRPVAEVWIGAHRAAPSTLEIGGCAIGLDSFIETDPVHTLGDATDDGRVSALPFMMKLLAADRPLSLQVHPNLHDAGEGFDREQAAGLSIDDPARCYRDRSHKPEMLYALGPFELLAGFRRPDRIRETLKGFNVPGLEPVLAALEHSDPEAALRAGFAAVLGLEPRLAVGILDSVVGQARRRRHDRPEYQLLTRLADTHPGDLGVVAAMFLNHQMLAYGDAIFIPAGVVHSYVHGLGVEVMATSDNVLRAGLTPKHVSIPEVMRTVTFKDGLPDMITPVRSRTHAVFAPPTGDFAVWVLEPSNEQVDGWLAGPAAGARLVVSCGSPAELDSGGRRLVLEPGRSAFISDADGPLGVRSAGTVAIACTPS